jgi:hypothetical protein
MTLALVFCDAASRIEGRPIDVGDAERWFGLMDQPIIRALDILTGDSRESSETALSDLALAYDQVRAEFQTEALTTSPGIAAGRPLCRIDWACC